MNLIIEEIAIVVESTKVITTIFSSLIFLKAND